MYNTPICPFFDYEEVMGAKLAYTVLQFGVAYTLEVVL